MPDEISRMPDPAGFGKEASAKKRRRDFDEHNAK
jgi:hypothetical protein